LKAIAVRIIFTTIVLLLVVTARAAAQNMATQSSKSPAKNANPTRERAIDKNDAINRPCLFDPARGEIPNCLRKDKGGELFIVPQYLKELKFEALGLAIVHSPSAGWMYVNRVGKVVISGVPTMDNWADEFHDGLVRIVRSGKYGFANSKGQVVISPIYDGAMNFEKGRAEVCKSCEDKCVDAGCEYRSFTGGEWFQINAKGIVLTRLHPPH
jgi:hypothetical protein